MCWGCITNESAIRLTSEQLEYLLLPLEEQVSKYESLMTQYNEEWIKLNQPNAYYQSPEMREVANPAPLSHWSEIRIWVYRRIACFQHGLQAHVYAVQLLEQYDKYHEKMGSAPHSISLNWRKEMILYAKEKDAPKPETEPETEPEVVPKVQRSWSIRWLLGI